MHKLLKFGFGLLTVSNAVQVEIGLDKPKNKKNNKKKNKKQGNSNPTVDVEIGNQTVEFVGTTVEGRGGNPVDAFYGVRFGKYDARWTNAYQFTDWDAKEDFTNPDFMGCTQQYNTPAVGIAFGELQVVGEEDCLKLNIYKPPNATKDSNLPVMVWIYGGGLSHGCISTAATNGCQEGLAYTGENLVEDTIFVSMQYRLGILGLLGSDKLRSLNENNATGTFAFSDQLLALKWINEYISNFGGDPNNVMLFGESEGAKFTTLHSISEASWPYFQKAATQSGAFLHATTPIDAANKKFDQVAAKLCSDDVNDTDALIECLQQADDLDLQTVGIELEYEGTNVIDDVFVFSSFPDALQADRVHDIPYLMGSNANDGSIDSYRGGIFYCYAVYPNITTRETLNNCAAGCLGQNLDKPYPVDGQDKNVSVLDAFAIDQLPQTTPPRATTPDQLNDWYWIGNAISSAGTFGCSTFNGVEDVTASPNFTKNIYVYQFQAAIDAGNYNNLMYDIDEEKQTATLIPGGGGATHGADNAFVFSNYERSAQKNAVALASDNPPTTYFPPVGQVASLEQIHNLEYVMSQAWINFAKTNDPGFGWRPWNNDDPTLVYFDFNVDPKRNLTNQDATQFVTQCAVIGQAESDCN